MILQVKVNYKEVRADKVYIFINFVNEGLLLAQMYFFYWLAKIIEIYNRSVIACMMNTATGV